MAKWTVTEGAPNRLRPTPVAEGALTGGVIKIADGQKLLKTVCSRHCLLMTGRNFAEFEMLSAGFSAPVNSVRSPVFQLS